MFDAELTSVIAIFAAIAALIVYISERSKRRLKTSASPLKLKKMPGTPDSAQIESTLPSADLEEWNFPKPGIPSSAASASPDLATNQTHSPHPAPKEQSDWRTPRSISQRPKGLATRAQLRETMVNMTILGPCRARAPFQDGD